jgi:hypothetical protein
MRTCKISRVCKSSPRIEALTAPIGHALIAKQLEPQQLTSGFTLRLTAAVSARGLRVPRRMLLCMRCIDDIWWYKRRWGEEIISSVSGLHYVHILKKFHMSF